MQNRDDEVNHMADKIQTAYEVSKNIYDDILTQSNFFSRLYIKLFWSGTDDNEIARKVLAYIPDDFSGSLLDVPVGTAVFTQRKWAAHRLAREKYPCEERLVHTTLPDGRRTVRHSAETLSRDRLPCGRLGGVFLLYEIREGLS